MYFAIMDNYGNYYCGTRFSGDEFSEHIHRAKFYTTKEKADLIIGALSSLGKAFHIVQVEILER